MKNNTIITNNTIDIIFQRSFFISNYTKSILVNFHWFEKFDKKLVPNGPTPIKLTPKTFLSQVITFYFPCSHFFSRIIVCLWWLNGFQVTKFLFLIDFDFFFTYVRFWPFGICHSSVDTWNYFSNSGWNFFVHLI